MNMVTIATKLQHLDLCDSKEKTQNLTPHQTFHDKYRQSVNNNTRTIEVFIQQMAGMITLEFVTKYSPYYQEILSFGGNVKFGDT